jgi:hypothetical protein
MVSPPSHNVATNWNIIANWKPSDANVVVENNGV